MLTVVYVTLQLIPPLVTFMSHTYKDVIYVAYL
jgi:hypothetical protein